MGGASIFNGNSDLVYKLVLSFKNGGCSARIMRLWDEKTREYWKECWDHENVRYIVLQDK